ncbi:polysaccharide pyruvyl transferase family protein [Rossellomorea aquimaris]|uniref:polysaccharide pyruvyl transferase family protein n=1 Tax=Rossellomorea aquimaris TaxID=189382 RepID=UPI001CD7BD58|nr:polysaccharide pyruvyl transferase family protein [Rossellomorea aquimaris]MCA1061473.1 polysaccharide pyruvyl transferase family protein [Rossellomorea aquimaris]
MKVLTITCHDVYNHGASLQAYSLMKYLQKCGHDARIIDYKPDYLSNQYNLLSINNPKWEKNILTKLLYLALKFPLRLRELQRKKAFDHFKSKYLRLTDFRYKSNSELRKKLPEADAFICGSDQIWNSLHQNGRDPAFYLDFVPNDKIKASYAASFAINELDNKYKDFVKEKISTLDKIGVREKSGIEILNRLNIKSGVNVVDPTLLLSKEEWNNVGQEKYREDYILVYDFDKSSLIRNLAIDIAEKKGYKIYSVNTGKVDYADRYFKFVGPDTFLSLVRDSKFIISNSFHAAVFSVIFEKNFIIVNRNEAINTRMRDFLEDLNLQDRLVTDINSLEHLLNDIEYHERKQTIEKKVDFSKKYLEEALSIDKRLKKVQ